MRIDRFFAFMAGALLTAALAAVATGTTNDLAPFFGGSALFAVLYLLSASPTVRNRLPFARPFGIRAVEVHEAGAEIRAGDMSHDDRLSKALTWDTEFWRLVEDEFHDKGTTLHRRYGAINRQFSEADLDRFLRARLDLLDSLMIGSL